MNKLKIYQNTLNYLKHACYTDMTQHLMQHLSAIIEDDEMGAPESRNLFLPLMDAINNIEGMKDLFFKNKEKDSSWEKLISEWDNLNTYDKIDECLTRKFKIGSFSFFSETLQIKIESSELVEVNGEYFHGDLNVTEEVKNKILDHEQIAYMFMNKRIKIQEEEERMSNYAREYYESWED